MECHSNEGDVVQISCLNYVEIHIDTDINILKIQLLSLQEDFYIAKQSSSPCRAVSK